MVAHDYPDKRP